MKQLFITFLFIILTGCFSTPEYQYNVAPQKDDFRDHIAINNFEKGGRIEVKIDNSDWGSPYNIANRAALSHCKYYGKTHYKFDDDTYYEGRRTYNFSCFDDEVALDIEIQKPKIKQKKNNIQREQLRLIGSGTGFFINSKGFLVSNNHVGGVCKKVKAIYNSNEYDANIVANDIINDLVLAKVELNDNAFLRLSNGGKFGEDIKVYGFPLSDTLSSSLKVTKGIISSLSGPQNNFSLIQIDAAIQPGNSGGPILNSKGNLVGVAVGAINSPIIKGDTITIPQNINFGIKSEILDNFLKANNVKFESSNEKINGLDKLALSSTIKLNCYNTLREARKYQKEGLVRNIIE